MIGERALVHKQIGAKHKTHIRVHNLGRVDKDFSAVKFKGYINVDIRKKLIEMYILESTKSNKAIPNSIHKLINESFHLWDFNTDYNKIMIRIVGKTMAVDSHYGLVYVLNSHSYKDIEDTEKSTPYKDIQLAEKLLMDGNKDFKNKKYESALDKFTKSYALDYVQIDAKYNRALVHHTMGNLEKACEDWKHLADLGQKDAMKYLEEYCK